MLKLNLMLQVVGILDLAWMGLLTGLLLLKSLREVLPLIKILTFSQRLFNLMILYKFFLTATLLLRLLSQLLALILICLLLFQCHLKKLKLSIQA